jgi:hypothetical protein
MRVIRNTGLLLSALALFTACTATTSTLRGRFARERDCPEAEVSVTNETGEAYRANGCGQSAVYICGAISQMGDHSRDCAEQDAVRLPHPPDRDRPVLDVPDNGVKVR